MFNTENEPVFETNFETEKQVENAPRLSRPVRTPRPRPPKPDISAELLWIALPFVFLLGLGTGWVLWANRSAAPVADAPDTTRYDVSEAGNPAIGPVGAPVTMIEFGDYQCTYCKHWYDTVHTRLMADYAGKIRFVYRDLPLSTIHPEAQSAAEAADCAGEQGDYWKYHDALFGAKYGLGTQAYTQYATDLGLDVSAFNTCVAERRYQSEVEDDTNFGLSLGLTGTPSFFINGLKVIGSQPYEVFKQVIDKELAAAASKKQ
ncbi:MAG: thioredoxin domain-containing protein [Anaerolineales bacterium]